MTTKMSRQEKVALIKQEKIVAIIRSKTEFKVQPILQTLYNSGIKVLEITSNTVNFEKELKHSRQRYPELLIGAGTVTNISIAKKSILAGAQFLVTPNTNIDVLVYAHKHNIPVLMGAITPTEICAAYEAGADLIKVFPANTSDASLNYFKAIKAPLDQIPMFAVGGINVNNIESWFKAGINGVGVGGALTCFDENNSLLDIESTAKTLLQIIKKY